MAKNNKFYLDKKDGRKREILIYEDHPLVTRRDFLSAGLMSFTAAAVAPSLLLSRNVFACEALTAGQGGSAMPAFIQLNLAGGGMLAANLVPRDEGGAIIENRNLMGLGRGALNMTGDFGNGNLFFQGSTLFSGLQSTADATTLANTNIIGIVARSRDDSNTNRFDISGLATAANLKGNQLPNLSVSDYRQMPAYINPPKELTVSSYQDVEGALGVQGPLGRLAKEKLRAAVELIKNLSSDQSNRVIASNSDSVKASVPCATESNLTLIDQDAPPTDPRAEAALQGIWGIAANTNPRDRSVVFSTLVFNALKKYTGPVRLQMGGYDYHNKTRTTGDTRDGEAGAMVGQILQTAAALNQPVFLYLSTDGSCRSAESDTPDSPWVSDRGQAGLTIIFVYNPNGRTTLTSPFAADANKKILAHQVGLLTAGQAADQNYVPGWNDERAALAVFLNYLKFAERTGAGINPMSIYSDVMSQATAGNPFGDEATIMEKIIRIA